MKRIIKSAIILLISITVITSCNKDSEPMDKKITTLNPNLGPKETMVTITGENFGTETNLVSVFFNGKEAEVLTVNDSEITTKVPVLAYTGLVTVIINGEELIGPKFTYTISEINSSIIAGNGSTGSVDGTGTNASFSSPISLAIDSQDNIFVTDTNNHLIRKITPNGVVTTFAGSAQGYADGTGTTVKFNYPYGITIDANDNLYVTDANNFKIRKITSAGVVTTIAGSTQGFADGIGTNAKFMTPAGIVISQDNVLYVTDQKNNRIRKITANGEVSTFSGSSQGYTDGTKETARYYWPAGITIDSEDNLYISDTYNNKIRKINTDGEVSPNNEVSTIAGSTAGFENGVGTIAKFYWPIGIAIDAQNNLYTADFNNDKIRKIDKNGLVSTLAGSTRGYLEGVGSTAKYNRPFGIAINSNGTIFIADTFNNRIRKITQE